ncbi:Oleate-activated transcription factor 1 [Lachancea thermotolerans]
MHNKQTKRNRRLHVCDACRIRKLKCDKAKPNCSRCAKHGLECIYNPYRQKEEPETVVALKKELLELRAQLVANSPASCTSEVSKPKISWDIFVTPVKVGGVWRSYYSPLSDVALFARDPFLRGLNADLFEQETAFHETQINLKTQDLTETDPRTNIKRLLPDNEVLMKSKTIFYTQLYQHYTFFQKDLFESLFEEVILKGNLDNEHTPFVLMSSLLISCLTNALSVPAEVIFHYADQLKIITLPSEHNLSCLLYLKIYSGDMKLCDSLYDTLSSSIRNMTMNLGLFASKLPNENANIRRNLWMGAVALLEPTSFDQFFVKKFEFPNSEHTHMLWYEYNFHLKLSQVWRCVLTSSSQLEFTIAQLKSYYKKKVPNNADKFLRASCELSLIAIELNILWMFCMQNELQNRPFDESLLVLLEEKFTGIHSLLTKDYCNLNKDTIRIKSLGFTLKTFIVYAIGMSLRQQKRDSHPIHKGLHEGFNFREMVSEVFLLWKNDAPWYRTLIRLWDFHETEGVLENFQQNLTDESQPLLSVTKASESTEEFRFGQLESPILETKTSAVSLSSSSSCSGSSSAFYEASDLINFDDAIDPMLAADDSCLEIDFFSCPASQEFKLDVNTH